MNDFLNLTLSGFGHFIGVLVLIIVLGRFIQNILTKILRHFILYKHGYPPEHCDADGEFKFERRRDITKEDK